MSSNEKIRVCHLAKKHGMTSKALVTTLQSADIPIKNHMSMVVEEEVLSIIQQAKGDGNATKSKAIATPRSNEKKAPAKKVVRIRARKTATTESEKPHSLTIEEESRSFVTESAKDVDNPEVVPPEGPQAKTISELEDGLVLTERRVKSTLIRRRRKKKDDPPVVAQTPLDTPQETADTIDTPSEADPPPIAEDSIKNHGEDHGKAHGEAAQEADHVIDLSAKLGRLKQKPQKPKPSPTIEKRKTQKLADLIAATDESPSASPNVSISVEFSEEETKPLKVPEPPEETPDVAASPLKFQADQEGAKIERVKSKISKEREDARHTGKRKVVSRDSIYYPPQRRQKRKKSYGAKDLKVTEITQPKASKRVVKISEAISVSELAQSMGVKASDLIKKLFDMGMLVTVNQSIDIETAEVIANEYNYKVENTAFEEEQVIASEVDKEEDLHPIPPVITVMGHVDHGKTSLLDTIRKSNVTAGEVGGITQHIGAYTVTHNNRVLTFLDTPGHEAFTAMRARGAAITNIVVLVVACDDGVMPQTREAINHAKQANVPIIVAVNKMDLPGANSDKIKQMLSEVGLVAEEWGGDTIFVETSAKTGLGVTDLLEMISLQSDILELKANPDKRAKGVVIEASIEKGRGPVATVLVREGTLRVGDFIIVGATFGKVRALINDKGKRVDSVGPSYPARIIGISDLPDTGDQLISIEDERTGKQLVDHRKAKIRETELAKSSRKGLDDILKKLQKDAVKKLNVIVKGDTLGSVEAVIGSLEKIASDKITIETIHSGVGGIIESDVLLASASEAIIVGFNVRPDKKAEEVAEEEGVHIELSSIIYELVDHIKKFMRGILEPEYREVYLGKAEVRKIYNIHKVGVVAGSYILDGHISRGMNLRLIRDNVVVHTGKIKSLRRFKEDIKEVSSGYECGITIENYNDIHQKDIIEVYTTEKVTPDLFSATTPQETIPQSG